MTPRLPGLVTAAVALAIASCVRPAAEATHKVTAPVNATAAAPEYKKPPRLNGRGKVSSISLEDFFARQQAGQVYLIDARPAFFHTLGHIPGSINLPAANCDSRIAAREAEIKAALAAGKSIVVYCTNFACPDARTVAIHLAGFGYSSSTLTGGWDAWRESGLGDL